MIDAVPATSLHVHQEATQQLSEEKQECAGTHAVQPVLPETQLCTQSNKGQMLKHINFWHEDELKMAHPEVQVPSPSMQYTWLQNVLFDTFDTLCVICLFGLTQQHSGLHSRYILYPVSCQKCNAAHGQCCYKLFDCHTDHCCAPWGALCSNQYIFPQLSLSST